MKNDNSLIFKNSIVLYVQFAIKMMVSLYSTRIILHALGSEDFGINNVVTGFVAMFSFISGTMSSTSQRFFACELGRGNKHKLNQYFIVTASCYVVITLIIVLMVEPLGLWFIDNKMVFPDNRINTVNIIFHLSVCALIFRMIVVPFESLMLAHEKMVVYAIVSMVDTIIVLIGALSLKYFDDGTRLIVYSSILTLVSIANFTFYYVFSKFNYTDCISYKKFWDKAMFVEVISYSGWSLFWTFSNVIRSQGINMLLNVFFNPVVNAARGIAYQVNNATNQFVNSFYQAVRPQIMKKTAIGDIVGMLNMMFSSTRISFYLVLMIAVPVIIDTPTIMNLWLGDYPQYTIEFTRLVLIVALIDALGLPPNTSICASGRVKWYFISTGIILILNLPFSYILLHIGCQPLVVFYILILMSISAQLVRIIYMKRVFGMSIIFYIKNVLIKLIIVSVLTFSTAYSIGSVLSGGGLLFVLRVMLYILVLICIVYALGLERNERKILKHLFSNKIVNLRNHTLGKKNE